MIDQDLAVDAEFFVKPFFVLHGTFCNIPHGEHVIFLQAVCLAGTDLPEVGQGRVLPEQIAVGAFVQLGDAHAVFVGRGFFCHDIHCHFGEVQVCADADRGRDAGGFQDVADHGHGHDVGRMLSGFPGLFFVQVQIGCGIHEHLVNAVDMDVFSRGVPQIDGIGQGGDPFVLGHARHCDVIEDTCVVHPLVQADRLLCLEQPGPRGNADRFERRTDRQADGLVGA